MNDWLDDDRFNINFVDRETHYSEESRMAKFILAYTMNKDIRTKLLSAAVHFAIQLRVGKERGKFLRNAIRFQYIEGRGPFTTMEYTYRFGGSRQTNYESIKNYIGRKVIITSHDPKRSRGLLYSINPKFLEVSYLLLKIFLDYSTDV